MRLDITQRNPLDVWCKPSDLEVEYVGSEGLAIILKHRSHPTVARAFLPNTPYLTEFLETMDQQRHTPRLMDILESGRFPYIPVKWWGVLGGLPCVLTMERDHVYDHHGIFSVRVYEVLGGAEYTLNTQISKLYLMEHNLHYFEHVFMDIHRTIVRDISLAI